MLVEQVKKLSPMKRFLYWIQERELVYRLKRGGHAKPWTDDTIIQRVYFTNVYREWDKTTVWYRQNVGDPLKDDPRVLFATICFRWFNLISTGEQLLKQPPKLKGGLGALTNWDLAMVKSRLHGLKEHGAQIFTGAFNISNSGSTKPKIDRVCDDYIQPVWERRHEIVKALQACDKLAQVQAILKKLPGLGGSGFMAAQVICDIKYTHLLNTFVTDWWTWCSPGPGSKRGMSRLLEKSETELVKNWLDNIAYVQACVNKALPNLPRFHAQDLQNCLCEFYKYERELFALGGHSKRGYQGS